MSDLNVTAPPFAPPDSNRVDVPARDGHVAPHPPTPTTRDIEGVRGDDDFDVSVVDPALATTVDAATRAAKENYELVRALCQLLTSTRAQVARPEIDISQTKPHGESRYTGHPLRTPDISRPTRNVVESVWMAFSLFVTQQMQQVRGAALATTRFLCPQPMR